jgi:hypothetical protein
MFLPFLVGSLHVLIFLVAEQGVAFLPFQDHTIQQVPHLDLAAGVA